MRPYRLALLATAFGLALALPACERAGSDRDNKADRGEVKPGKPAVAKKVRNWGMPDLPGLPWYVTGAAFSPDGRYIAAGDSHNIVAVYDSRGAERWCVRGAKYETVNGLGFATDGTAVFSAHSDGTLNRWDAAGGRLVWSHPEVAGPEPMDDRRAQGLVGLVVSSDGTHLLVASAWNFLLCATSTGKVERSWRGGVGYRGLALSPDGKLALAGFRSDVPHITGEAVLWDVGKGKELWSFEAKGDATQSAVAFSADGRQAVTGSLDGAVRFWEVATRKLRHTLHLHADPVSALALSPDGRLGLSGDAHNGGDRAAAVLLWDVLSGKVVHRLAGIRGEVKAVAFSADGKRALAAGGVTQGWGRNNGVLLVWDVASGKVVARPSLPKEQRPLPSIPSMRGSGNTPRGGSALSTRITGPDRP